MTPFFVVGADRSGTTLLRVMLERHPQIAIPPESHFIPRLWQRRGRYAAADGRLVNTERFLADLAAEPRFMKWELPIEAVEAELGRVQGPRLVDGIEAPFRAYARTRGKAVWGDKTPGYAEQIPLLNRLWPGARFVHMIRDGRDVALSTFALGGSHRTGASAARYWAARVQAARQAAPLLGDAYFELRYEDLLDDAEAQLRRLSTFLGVEYDAGMLVHDAAAIASIPARERERHASLVRPPTKGLRDWRLQMSHAQVSDFEAIARRELVSCGYELAFPAPGVARRAVAITHLATFMVRSTLPRGFRRLRRGRNKRRWRKAPPSLEILHGEASLDRVDGSIGTR